MEFYVYKSIKSGNTTTRSTPREMDFTLCTQSFT